MLIKAVALTLFVSALSAAPRCEITHWQNIDIVTIDAIRDAVCVDQKTGAVIELSRISGEWARTLVNGQTIYYLHKINSVWTIVAKGERFTIPDWEKFSIPTGIR